MISHLLHKLYCILEYNDMLYLNIIQKHRRIIAEKVIASQGQSNLEKFSSALKIETATFGVKLCYKLFYFIYKNSLNVNHFLITFFTIRSLISSFFFSCNYKREQTCLKNVLIYNFTTFRVFWNHILLSSN
jgi:hypothetical protein